MNEELKIIIRAVADSAKKELANVRNELEKVKEQSDKTGQTIDTSMKNVGKSVAVALGAIVGLTTAMASLGKASQEYQKAQARLVAGFNSAGASAEQAKKTYKELFGILGDVDSATEAAQSLARITTEEKALGEYTKILTGIWAEYGQGMPMETIAESIAETAASAKITGDLSRALIEAGISEDAFNAKLQSLNSQAEREAFIRATLISLYGASAEIYARNNAHLIEYNNSQDKLNNAMANVGKYITPMLTALNNLGAYLLQVLTPAFKVVSAAIIVFCEWLAVAVSWVASLFGIDVSLDNMATSIGSVSSGFSDASSGIEELNDGLSQGVKTAKELKKQTMGFDELNVVSKPTSASSGAGTGAGVGGIGGVGGLGGISIPTIDTSGLVGGISDFDDVLEEVRGRMEAILVLVGLTAAGILAWKLLDLYTSSTSLLGVFKQIGAQALIIGGALLLVKGYSDGWVDGVDWSSLLITLGGIAAVLAGLYIQFGAFGLAIGAVAAGIALVVLGVKDFINNGPSIQNTILIIGGAIAVAIGLATAGISVLISAIVAAVVAIGAFIAAIVLEKPAIQSVEEAQEALTDAKQKAADAENNYINAVDNAEASLKKLEEAEKKAGITGEELFKQVQDGTLDYANMTDAQKEVYKAYLDNEKKQKELEKSTKELTDAKKAETIASYEHQLALAKESGDYESYKKAVVKAFEEGSLSAEEAQELLSKSMSEMSDDSQQTFMKDLPSNLKNGLNPHQYESTGTKIKKWFSNLWTDIKNTFKDIGTTVGNAIADGIKTAINWIMEKAVNRINSFIDGINWAIGIINKIPNVNISKLSRLSVPKLATGGITNGATVAMIGEAGKEAVLPLENNTGWMDALADRIASRNGAPSKIVLMLNEKELGWANINSINSITKQTGTLQLSLV